MCNHWWSGWRGSREAKWRWENKKKRFLERDEVRRGEKWEGGMTLGWNKIKILYHKKEKRNRMREGETKIIIKLLKCSVIIWWVEDDRYNHWIIINSKTRVWGSSLYSWWNNAELNQTSSSCVWLCPDDRIVQHVYLLQTACYYSS